MIWDLFIQIWWQVGFTQEKEKLELGIGPKQKSRYYVQISGKSGKAVSVSNTNNISKGINDNCVETLTSFESQLTLDL